MNDPVLNNEALLEKIYQDESAVLYGYLLKRMSEDKANDIIQESFVKLFEILSRGKKISNYRAYLFQIARNLIINVGKVSNRSVLEDDNDKLDAASYNTGSIGHFTPEEELIKKELTEHMNEIVNRLTTTQRELFELRWYYSMKTTEIALVFGKSERQIRRDIQKLVKLFREIFKAKGWQVDSGLPL